MFLYTRLLYSEVVDDGKGREPDQCYGKDYTSQALALALIRKFQVCTSRFLDEFGNTIVKTRRNPRILVSVCGHEL